VAAGRWGPAHRGRHLLELSLTHRQLGRYDEARAHAEQALILARDHSFRVVEGQTLTALSATAELEGSHATAVELGQEALANHRRTGHHLGEARTPSSAGGKRLGTSSAVGVPPEEYRDPGR
jgi:tetratricopeptide (TPR) repeat protein